MQVTGKKVQHHVVAVVNMLQKACAAIASGLLVWFTLSGSRLKGLHIPAQLQRQARTSKLAKVWSSTKPLTYLCT